MYDYRYLSKELRKSLIITQAELAGMLGVSFASVNRWENGRYEPTTKIKRKLVELCRKNNIELREKSEE